MGISRGELTGQKATIVDNTSNDLTMDPQEKPSQFSVLANWLLDKGLARDF